MNKKLDYYTIDRWQKYYLEVTVANLVWEDHTAKIRATNSEGETETFWVDISQLIEIPEETE